MSSITDVILESDSDGLQGNRAGRPARKRPEVERYIRGKIISGRWKPGRQLPTQIQLREQMGASNQTMLEAIERLAQDGFIRTDGRRGTFVCEHPPHLNRFALLFSSALENRTLGTLYPAMANEAARLNALNDPTTRVAPFFNINGHQDEPEYRRLMVEIERQSLAGLAFASAPHLSTKDERLWNGQLPRAALMSVPMYADTPIVNVDTPGFGRRAAEYLLARGRRKLGLIVPIHPFPEFRSGEAMEKPLVEALLAGGMELPSWRIVAMPHMAVRSVAEVTRLLMRLEPAERPDALVVADDSHIPGVVEGLTGTGGRKPLVIGHCNHPVTDEAPGVTYLGYDVRTLVRHLIEQIRVQRNGGAFDQVVMCPALFADEIVSDRVQV
jgi:DNA-binding LacI/PurR family transcriptional regulator